MVETKQITMQYSIFSESERFAFIGEIAPHPDDSELLWFFPATVLKTERGVDVDVTHYLNSPRFLAAAERLFEKNQDKITKAGEAEYSLVCTHRQTTESPSEWAYKRRR